MLKYRLINYFDVWGNETDGWEVNDLCEEGMISLPDDFTDSDIIKALKGINFLNDKANTETVSVMSDPDMIEFFETATNMPIGRLELIKEEY